MAISLTQAVQVLLAGQTLSWAKFHAYKAGSIVLADSAQRRLFAFLLGQDPAKVAQGNEALIDGLLAAWTLTDDDPASPAVPPAAAGPLEVWRLERIEASSFGGLTVFGGEKFDFWIEGENWCLQGQNGAGKTSLASAMMWTLTGKRIRDQDGLVEETGARAPVNDPDGRKIGDWPPLASYPTSPADLLKPVEVWARLTFKNANGEVAMAERKLSCPVNGTATPAVNIDPRLLQVPQLIETSLLMPARLARIGFGERSQSLYEAVKILTGLDQLADIAEGCGHFIHRGRKFLRYAKDNGIDGHKARFDENMERAKAKAEALGLVLPNEQKIDDNSIAVTLRAAATSASDEAGTHLATLKSEIAVTLDTTTAQGRATIRTAVSTARGVVNQHTTGIQVFAAWTALKEARGSESFARLPAAIADARAKLAAAVVWHGRQTEDRKFRLKALAAQFFVPSHNHDYPARCPVCESALTTEAQQCLAAELAELRRDATEAERQLEDVCRAIDADLEALLPQNLKRYADILASMNPRDAYLAAVRGRFCEEPPFKDVLVGLAAVVERTVAGQHETLPNFTYPEFAPDQTEPPPAVKLRAVFHGHLRLATLVDWWSSHRDRFREAWAALIGLKQEDGSFPAGTIEAQLLGLEQALAKAAPLDELSKFLIAAAVAAESWEPINTEQKRREAVAVALQPLKDLRDLVDAETASSIDRLSGRMKDILARIHHHERLTYEQTTVARKAVTVDGSFDAGMQIDAAYVANTSWLRALLWAFVLALREETIAQLGANPFPLMVLDDPQTTFDPRNKLKWAEEIARLANLDRAQPEGVQLFLTTHERQFYQCLVDHQALSARLGFIGGVNKASGVAKIVNGGCLERRYREALDTNNDKLGRDYIRDVRIYCEDLLKFVLRGEGPQISGLTIGKLTHELKRLKKARTPPFDRKPVEDLINTLDGGGGKPMKLINESHHSEDEALGVAEATDVEAFWKKTLRGQVHDVFELYDTYVSFYGEPRAFPWAKDVVPFPEGFRTEVKAAAMQKTGVAVAAKTDGRAGDGVVSVKEWDQGEGVVLPNHEIYQLAAGTLDPIASIGDLLIVCNHASIRRRNLVVAQVGDALLARRYNEVEAHPEIAVLTGQSVDPTVLAEPVIISPNAGNCRKVVGTVFAAHAFPPPPSDPKHEIVALHDPAAFSSMMSGARLLQVKGRSAEPIALDGQFLITRDAVSDLHGIKKLDGRMVVAVDDTGARYFKRLRCNGSFAVLESLNPDGTTAAEILSTDGARGLPQLAHAVEVLGVLFELP